MELPTLQAMVLAERVYVDRATNKYLIVGTFGVLAYKRGEPRPTAESSGEPGSELVGPVRVVSRDEVAQAGTPCLYLALRGIRGPTVLRLRYQRLDDETVLFEGKIDVECQDPVSLVELSVDLPSLLAPSGPYSLDLLCDGRLLGQWRLNVVEEDASHDHD
jgi:hypothetical protein